MKRTSSRSAILWIVATPIGNLGDISKRAIDTLKKVDLILAEDTRTATNLLNFLGIGKKKFISIYDEVEKDRVPEVIKYLKKGLSIALMSEAGSPVISDPGYLIVRECKRQGIKVSVLPGPCAPICALMISGIEPTPFTFLGFLPRKEGDKKKIFSTFNHINSTLVFFERKSRLMNSLKIANQVLKGDREVAIVRELTKIYEEVINFPLSEYEKLRELKGEITVVISPPRGLETKTPRDEVIGFIKQGLRSDLSNREVVKSVQRKVVGWTKKEIYNISIRLFDEV